VSYFVNTLYILFLGILCRNLVLVQLSGAGTTSTIQVYGLLRKSNMPKTIPLLLLFTVDWICFQFIYPPTTHFSFRSSDAFLLILYVPVLVALGVAVLFSLEDSLQFCIPAAIYNVTATVAESGWLVIRLRTLDLQISSGEVAWLLGIMLLYIIGRALLFALYLAVAAGRATRIRPEILTVTALFFKPALFVLLARFETVSTFVRGLQ